MTINKVLVIGSGPIVIGQAAEFDYSGTQACKVLRAESKKVILVNNNPATIMTDQSVADAVYSEPLTVEFLERIIKIEKPDALLAGMGGQTALNLSMQLFEKGILEKYNVQVIGTNIQSIENSENRELFKDVMTAIKEPCLKSYVVSDYHEAKAQILEIGYPIVVRPAYTLGGTGGGFCYNDEDLMHYVTSGTKASRTSQVLIEKSIKGWKEIEYEMMRDYKGNTIVVCNMENFDPVGVHTGDSIVVAPSQTLPDSVYQMLRRASINIVSALEIVGGCNVQLALSPDMKEYYVIEVNPRVSRSSALASKATGYPIAKVATKIALGYDLDEISNDVTQKTMACFEPSLDYCALKIPKWPFSKFASADRSLSTQMKATGEIMSLAANFEMALLKGIRSLGEAQEGLYHNEVKLFLLSELFEKVQKPDDLRLYYIAELLRRQVSPLKINKLTDIDLFFINKILNIVRYEEKLTRYKVSLIEEDLLNKVKKYGFSDRHIADLTLDGTEEAVRKLRLSFNIKPVYKMVDTCAGEFQASSPYYYSTYDQFCENIVSDQKKVVVIGSGPITIGQGVEFDYCSVHSVSALQKLGYEAILINNNPETVSTDFDVADKLYFEPITIEDVMNVIDLEQPEGVLLQFGGQTAINLAEDLKNRGVKILGAAYEEIHAAEDRDAFNERMDVSGVLRPRGEVVNHLGEALQAAEKLGYPVLVRPSFVIGGAGMKVVYDAQELMNHLNTLPMIEGTLLDEFLTGIEIEVDCISDGIDFLIPGIMEHLEHAGVHSGDSISVYPPQHVSEDVITLVIENTKRITEAFKINGIMNIQYVYAKNSLYVIEVNPRASRTVPFLSKVTNTPMIDIAVRAILGQSIKSQGYPVGLLSTQDFVAIKYPVFSLDKMNNVDTCLDPQMKSTGEILSIEENFNKAYLKCLKAIEYQTKHKAVLMTVSDVMKHKAVELAKILKSLDFTIYATKGTVDYLKDHHITSIEVNKIGNENSVLELIERGKIDMVINVPSKGNDALTDGFKIRRVSVEQRIPCYTKLETVYAKLSAMTVDGHGASLKLYDLCDIN